MPHQTLTVKAVEALRPRARQYEIAEKGGLRVRIYPSGRMSYCYRYKDQAGRQRVLTLGEVRRGKSSPAGITLTQARDRLTTAKADRERGVDPADRAAAEKQSSRKGYRERAMAPTVGDVLDEYLARHVAAKCRPATQVEFKRLVEKELKPRLKELKAAETRRTQVVAALDEIADKATPSVADHAGNVLRSAFRFAVARGRLESSPAQALPRYAKQAARERVLTTDEIKALWEALDTSKGASKPLALALKLLLLTAQRRGSIATATWSEFRKETWEIPAAHAKTGKTHIVPLTPMAQDVVGQLRKQTGETSWVLPRPKLDGPVTPRSLTRAMARLRTGDYTVHDLRRTGASLMAEAGVSRFLIARVLGHADESMTGIYDRHEYQAEKRRALEKLAGKVGAIIGEKQEAEVVNMR